MNLQKLNSLILCNKALICENNCTHLIESGGILTYKEGLSLLGNIMQIQSINVGGAWFLLIRSPAVHLRVRNSSKRWYGLLKYKFYFKNFIRSKNFDLEKFSVKKSNCIFFPPRATCFWCNIVLMSFFYQFNSANDQKHSYFAIWENESASFLFSPCVINCF